MNSGITWWAWVLARLGTRADKLKQPWARRFFYGLFLKLFFWTPKPFLVGFRRPWVARLITGLILVTICQALYQLFIR